MSNTNNIRQRSSAKNGTGNGAIHILRDVSESSGASTVIRKTNKTLHNSVWNRLIAIVVLFTILALFTSRIERYEQSAGGGTGNSSSVRAGGRDGLSFVTIVMPSVVNPDARPARLTNIAKTWGDSSHAIYVVHDTKEYSEGIGIDKSNKIYPQNLLLPNHITVEKGVERLEYVIRTIHKEIDPDFAFFVNDHTFVLPYHLCQFLQEHDSSKDLYAGHALKGQKETSFNSGAAGYVLSRSTMQRLIKEWDNPNSSCSLRNASKWLQGNPGLLTAQCFDQVLHVPVVDTRDKLDLSHKFHAYGLIRTVSGNIDDWYINKHKTLDDIFGVDNTYHHLPQDGAKCCSANSISFHYVEAGESIVFWEVLQKIHESPAMSDVEIKDLMNEIWPKDRLGFGGYSQKLPPPEQSIWSDIIQVVRKIAVGAEPASC